MTCVIDLVDIVSRMFVDNWIFFSVLSTDVLTLSVQPGPVCSGGKFSVNDPGPGLANTTTTLPPLSNTVATPPPSTFYWWSKET